MAFPLWFFKLFSSYLSFYFVIKREHVIDIKLIIFLRMKIPASIQQEEG